MEKTHMNHLAQEKSPYLLQHVHNPVDWYPWGEEALTKAKKENKPILLSIGYAACHWCHVMAHESFEDAETAELMNMLYVNIKVDREERPDIDKIYQTAHALLTQRGGGWPLTVFLTPDDLMPFFSGTYFPLEARQHLPAFKYVLRSLSDLYRNHRHEITAQNKELKQVLSHQYSPDTKDVQLSLQPIEEALRILHLSYDPKNGGFGMAPKFPQASMLEFLIEQTHTQTDQLKMAYHTLQHMANGGIYDQLGSGFFRYSVDAEWRIPHFEKMLYDNAQLLQIYAIAAREYADPFFAKIAYDTAQWILRVMQAPQRGFYASLDADSEGQEGKYYTWNKFEIQNVLTAAEYAVIHDYFGLTGEANVENLWHLHVAKNYEAVAKHLKISTEETKSLLASAKEKLLALRNQRIAPACDTKILTAWNALLIQALLIAGSILQEQSFIDAAKQTLDFIHERMWVQQKLAVSFREEQLSGLGFLDDYAFLLSAVMRLLQTEWSEKYLTFAIQLADILMEQFYDKENGGFYFTSNQQEVLIHRPKPMTDEAIPAGNGVALRALTTLGYLLGESRYLQAVQKTLTFAWDMLSRYPVEHCSLLLALFDFLEPPFTVILRGKDQAELKKWHDYAKEFIHLQIFAIPHSAEPLPGTLGQMKQENKITAIVCQGTQCLAAIDDFAEFKAALKKRETS